MKVNDIMTKDVETIGAEANLFDAAQKMKTADTGALPVVDEVGNVIGMLTDRDIVLRAVSEGADPRETRVEQAMTRDVITCRPDCPIEDAGTTMRERQVRRLVITQEHNKNVVGIISLGDIAVRSDQNQLVGAATEGVCQPNG